LRVPRVCHDDDLKDYFQCLDSFAPRAWVEVGQNYKTSGEPLKPLAAPHNGSFVTIKGQELSGPPWNEVLYKTKASLDWFEPHHFFFRLGRFGMLLEARVLGRNRSFRLRVRR